MEFDPTMQEGMRRSNARFMASMTRIIEQYSHPFRNDILISMDSLTYDTPQGPKQWDHMSRKDVKNWKKGFMRISRRPRNTGKQSCDFEDENSAVRQESSENSGADTSDTGEEGGDVASAGRKSEGIRLKNRNVDDGQILKKKRVPVDVILQGDERNIPKWITITTPRPSKSRHSTLPGRELLGPKRWDHMSRKDVKTWKKGFTRISRRPRNTGKQSCDFEDENSAVRQESSENSGADTSDTGEEGGDIASVGKKFEGIRLKNRNVDDGQILKKKRVPVDVILQGDERNIPKWITITTPSPSKSRHSTLPGRELLGPKQWDHMSRKDVKTWKKGFTSTSRRPRNTGKQSCDFEDENSAVRQESSENSGADTSDTGEEGGDVASVGKKFEGIRLKNRNVDDGQILKKKRVPVDVILQGDERNIPKWITITTPSPSKSRHSTLPGRELLGEEGGDVASVGKKFEGIRLKNRNVDDGQILKKKRVPVDVILQGDERNIPKWITITTPSPSKSRHSTLPGRELLGPKQWDHMSRKDVKTWKKGFTSTSRRPRNTGKQSCDFEDENSAVRQESSENSGADTSDTGEEGGDIASVGKKFEGIRLKNRNVDDGQILKKKRVPVDVILQGDERNIPKWITITTPSPSKSRHSALPGRELLGSQAAVCRKKLEFSNERSSSKYPQLQHSAVPISSNTTVASPRHRPCPELSTTSCDSSLGEYQSADEECSLSSTTLSGLYPAMVAIFTKFMRKHSQRKVLKYMFGHLRSKRRHSRRPKLSVTVDKMRGFGPCKCKPKKAFHSMCSCRSEDNQNPTSGNESREFRYDSCPVSNSSGLMPYACADTNEIKMHYSDSSLEQSLASGKSQEVCKHTAFPGVMDRMGETFLVEDKLQTIASPKNSEYTEGEKFTYERFSEPSFITSASSDSRAFHLVKESKTQKTDFCIGTSELRSSACSSHGNRNNSIPATNCSPARSSNTKFIYPQKITSFQHKESFSTWKQSSSKRDEEIDAAFDELYYRVISGEYFKPLTLARPVLNSENHEEKGTLVKSKLSDSERSLKQCDIEFEKLCGKSVPKSPGLQRASNFRKYEEIQMPETVNALVNSPDRTYSPISSAKRAGNFQNHLLCSPVKRLRFIPEYCSSSSKCQEISHSKEGNLQTGGMDFLSTYNCSKPSFFADRSCHCQGSGSHDSSQQSFLGISGTSLQESGTAGARSRSPGAMENGSSLRNVSKHHPRVYRKLSYTDGKGQL